MGGSLSAQSADLHSVWCTYTLKHMFRTLADLHGTPEGYTYWQGCYGSALCQFKDNIVQCTPP